MNRALNSWPCSLGNATNTQQSLRRNLPVCEGLRLITLLLVRIAVIAGKVVPAEYIPVDHCSEIGVIAAPVGRRGIGVAVRESMDTPLLLMVWQDETEITISLFGRRVMPLYPLLMFRSIGDFGVK